MSKRGRGHNCEYCKRRMEAAGSRSRLAATRDHVVPQVHGGTRTVWACRHCNGLKGDMMPDEWSAFMAAYPRWWTMDQFRDGANARRALAKHRMFAARAVTTNPEYHPETDA